MKLTGINTCFESLVLPGLERIVAKTRPDWTIANVYEHCLANEWLLFTDPGTDGFIMVEIYKCKYTGNKIMHIPCAYCSGKRDSVSEYMPFLKMLATQMDIHRIELKSPRSGWKRKGFKPVETLYRMEV